MIYTLYTYLVRMIDIQMVKRIFCTAGKERRVEGRMEGRREEYTHTQAQKHSHQQN